MRVVLSLLIIFIFTSCDKQEKSSDQKKKLTKKTQKKALWVVDQEKYEKARKLLEEGRQFMRQTQLEKALDKLEQAIEIYPKLKEAYMDRGDIFQAYKDYHKALKEYERVLKIHPRYAIAYFRCGYAYLGLKKWDRAIDMFSKAIKYKNDYADAYEGRSIAYRSRGEKLQNNFDFEKSIEDYEKCRQLEKEQKK